MEKVYEITKNIIKESIKSVICIDDEFLQPYSKNSDRENNNMAKELYDSFSGEYNCLLDIVKYNSQNQCINKLNNRDLLILDWELTQSEPKFGEALNILEMATISDIPFICIYTQTPNIESIYNMVLAYFSGYTKKDTEETKEIANELSLDEILEEHTSEISDAIFTNGCFNKIRGKIHSNLTPDERNLLKKENIKIDDDFLKKWYFQKTNCHLPDKKQDIASPTKIIKKHITSAINLNGKILTVLPKSNKYSSLNSIEKVSPSHLLDKLSENIAEEPNNLFNIIWFQYKNYFNNIIYKQADFFQNITQDTFVYHYKQLAKEESLYGNDINSFDNFFNELYKDDLISKLNLYNLKTNDLLINYLTATSSNVNPNEKELVELNYYYSISKEISNNNRNIRFGDIFKCIDRESSAIYFVCVTAHCDCLRPKDKINNNYFFVKGSKTDNIKALNNAEKKQYSFIFDSEYISIEWFNKLVTLHIDENSKLIDKDKNIETYYKNEKIKIKYICNLKENYAQRIANWAFSNANTVGITYAKLNEKTDNKDNENSKTFSMNYDDENLSSENVVAITNDDTN